jgi:uncharacterized protein
VDPDRQSRDLDPLISAFSTRVPEVLHALVVSSDGVPLAASERMRPGQPAQLAAITSGLVGLARAAAGLFDDGALVQALVAMERGTLVVMAIDEEASLAVLTSAADLDAVAYEMTRLVAEIACA